jgi:hypothetical protein
MGNKEEEIMNSLTEKVFQPILDSPKASDKLKCGVKYTIMRLNERDAAGMMQYYWSAIIGTERSKSFAALMKKEGFGRFEEYLEDFRDKFTDAWLRKP